jgi:hypothetical protein
MATALVVWHHKPIPIFLVFTARAWVTVVQDMGGDGEADLP